MNGNNIFRLFPNTIRPRCTGKDITIVTSKYPKRLPGYSQKATGNIIVLDRSKSSTDTNLPRWTVTL